MRVPAVILRSSVAARAAAGLLVTLAATPVFAVSVECHALADSRPLSAALIGTLLGDAQSFDRVQASFVAVNQDLGKEPASAALRPLLASMNAHADQLLQQRELVRQDRERLLGISRNSNDLLEASEVLASLMLQNGANAAETAAILQLAMLSQRLGRSADAVIGWDGVRPEAVFLLGKDLKTFGVFLAGLKEGDAPLRLRAQRQPAIQQQLARSQDILDGMNAAAGALLEHLRELAAARVAQAALQQEADQFAHVLALDCAGSDAGAVGPLRLPAQAQPTPPSKKP